MQIPVIYDYSSGLVGVSPEDGTPDWSIQVRVNKPTLQQIFVCRNCGNVNNLFELFCSQCANDNMQDIPF